MATAQASAALAAGAVTPPTGPASDVREPSGSAWVARFPTSSSVADCAEPFRANLTAFVAALRAAGAVVNVAATLRYRDEPAVMKQLAEFEPRIEAPAP